MKSLEDYRNADSPLPSTYWAWQVFGAGMENVGKDGKPVEVPLREVKDNEILIRGDVLGLCLSDMKIIAQGPNHARLRGRDLANDPTVLGHECACTVVAIGAQWKDKFEIGQRFIVQADIYVNGVGFAFGYMIPGGLAEYAYLDERALDGDEGCYLLPVKDETGYSQSALAEPWACVEMSYCLEERLAPRADKPNNPLVVVDSVDESCKESLPNAVIIPQSLEGFEALPHEGYDDIIIKNPTPAMVNTLSEKLNKDGNMWLVGEPGEDGDVTIDVGAIHYENKRFFGGGHCYSEIGKVNERNDLLSDGAALFIGAGGPMGQMHVQRALEKADGPKRVVVTDLDRSRLDHIVNLFEPLAKARNAELITLSPDEFDSPQAMTEKMKALAPNGYNDIVVLAPVAFLVQQAIDLAADNAFINVFAGLVIGTMATIPLSALCRGIKIIGCSGSRVQDLKRVLDLVEANELDTNRSVAAIGGLDAAHEGLFAVKNASFPGKTVIYTQIRELPLIPLGDIPEKLPEIADKLSPEGAWTKEAELALLAKYL